MILLEFYDIAPIENIITSLTMPVDKIFFIGSGKAMDAKVKKLENFLTKKDIDAKVSLLHIDDLELSQIVSLLESIIENEDEIVVDLNGGEDLLLVGMGIVFERYKNLKKIELHRYNIKKGTVSDCDGNGIVYPTPKYSLTVKENIELHGGAIRSFGSAVNNVNELFVDNDFRADVFNLWSICKKDPSAWNKHVSLLNEVEAKAPSDKFLIDYSLNLSNVREKDTVLSFLKLLESKSCIQGLNVKADKVSYSYKNLKLKYCLDKAGNVLEFVIFILASELKNKDGTPLYNDAVNGVFIDWDGVINTGSSSKDVENEIDVFLMKGLVPILISCKNGGVSADELYKLSTVADRFGGGYARRVLVTTKISGSEQSRDALRCRAAEMDIEIIENVNLMSEAELSNRLRNIRLSSKN